MQLTLTLKVCNHIAGKIRQDMLDSSRYKTITEFIALSKSANTLIRKYTQIDNANHNSRAALLYAIYTIVQSGDLTIATFNEMTTKVFERLVT